MSYAILLRPLRRFSSPARCAATLMLFAGLLGPQFSHAQCSEVNHVYFEKFIPVDHPDLSDDWAVAIFGIQAPSLDSVEIPIGANNYFQPPPSFQGQPQTFGGNYQFGILTDTNFDLTWNLCGYTATASMDMLSARGTPLMALKTPAEDTVLTVTDTQLRARLPGGVRFYTDAADDVGVALTPGSAGWAVTSDSTKKEHFRAADGERFLNEIRGMRLGSWSYEAQPDSVRHYGPTAQAFYDAFGRDGLGTVGTDTTIAGTDADGVLFIAVQALERRTRALQKENERLRARMDRLEAAVRALRQRRAEP